MACTLGLYLGPRQPSRDTGEPCRDPSDTTDSRSENTAERSWPEREPWPGERAVAERGRGEGERLGPPVLGTPRRAPLYGGVKQRSDSSNLPRSDWNLRSSSS